MRHGALGVDRERQNEGAVGDGVERCVERTVQHLIHHAGCGALPLAGLREPPLDLGAVSAGAKHRFGGRPPGGEQPLRHAFVLAHQRQRRRIDLDGAPRARRRDVGGLHVRREPPRRRTQREALAVVAAPGRGVVREDPGVEQRLAQLEMRVVPLRQRDVEVRGKAVLTQQAIERGVRRVHEVADVGHALKARIARSEAQGREEEPAGVAHVGRCAALRHPFGGEAEVSPQGRSGAAGQGVGLLRGHCQRSDGKQHQRDR